MKCFFKRTVGACLICLMGPPAFAHSVLEMTVPGDGSIVTEVPLNIALDFKGDIRLTRVIMTHAESEDVKLDIGEFTSFMKEFAIPLQDMGAGRYLIEWRGLASDGHALKGSFAFTVKE